MLFTRILTAAVLLPLFVGGLFFLPAMWWGLALVPLVCAGGWEWSALAGFGRIARGCFCATLLLVMAAFLWAGGNSGDLPAAQAAVFMASVLFWVLLAPLWLFRGWRIRNPLMLAITGWILLVPTWLALLRLQEYPWLLLAVMGVVWIADSAAYFAGHCWGRRKLAPAISPGKTWEGVAGAAVAVTVYYLLVWHLGFGDWRTGLPFIAAALVAVLLPLSIIGDLFESWMKRQAGVKDSGRLLPGHGGVLDRIDALTSTLPLAALAVAWMMHRG
jgi:phosphatidate cytidylyltransferase